MVSARDVCLCAKPRLQSNGWKSIASFGRNGPCTDVVGTEGAELPEGFVIKIRSGIFCRNGARDSGTQAVAHFMRRASFEGRLLVVQAQVIDIEGPFAG